MEFASLAAPVENATDADAPAAVPAATDTATNQNLRGPIRVTIDAVTTGRILHTNVFLACCNASQLDFPENEAPSALYLPDVVKHLGQADYVLVTGSFFTVSDKKQGQDLEEFLGQAMAAQFGALMEGGHCDAVLGLCGPAELTAMKFVENGVHFASPATVAKLGAPCVVKHLARGGAERFAASAFIRAPARDSRGEPIVPPDFEKSISAAPTARTPASSPRPARSPTSSGARQSTAWRTSCDSLAATSA